MSSQEIITRLLKIIHEPSLEKFYVKYFFLLNYAASQQEGNVKEMRIYLFCRWEACDGIERIFLNGAS